MHNILGQYAQALEFSQKSLMLKKLLGDRAGEAEALGNIGIVSGRLGQYAQALANRWQAARLTSEIVRSIGRGRRTAHQEAIVELELSANMALVRLPAHSRERVELEAGKSATVLDLALDFLERRRGQGLIQSDRTIAPASQQVAIDRIAGELQALERAIRKATDAARGPLIERRGELGKELARAIEMLRGSDAAIASVRYPEPPRLAEVQQVLKPGEMVLVYFLPGFVEENDRVRQSRSGRARTEFVKRAWLVAITREQARAIRIGGARFEIAQLNRRLVALRRALRQAGQGLPAATYRKNAFQLHELLVKPAISDGVQRLIVVPDGLLHGVPFAALVESGRGSEYHELAYLGRRYELQTVQSLLHLLTLRRAARRARGNKLVAFGAPDFGSHDKHAGLSALPGTRREVARVAEFFSRDSRRIHLGREASEERAKDPGSYRGARVVHFATHALVDPERPYRSGIVLARTGKQDGVLRGGEIFELKIPAELVVLSACKTGTALARRGEGTSALARIFQVAGTPSVLASLWQVSDAAAAELMVEFYRGWIKRRLTRSAALARAQAKLIESKKWSPPYYWAAFEVMGEGD